MGAQCTSLDIDPVDVSLGRHSDGQPMGLYGVGLGWLLGLGRGGKRQLFTVAYRYRFSAQHYHSRTTRYSKSMEHGADWRHLLLGDSGHLYHAQRHYRQRA